MSPYALRWVSDPPGQSGSRWAAAGALSHTDPYLAWLDLTHFRGTSLPGKRGMVIPLIRELKAGEFDTSTLHVNFAGKAGAHELLGLLKSKRLAEVQRFEVAAGFVSDRLSRHSSPAGWMPQSAGTSLTRCALVPRPLVAFIDYGCAFANQRFLRPDCGLASTRVLALWDQNSRQQAALTPPGKKPLQWGFPPDFMYGVETHRERRWAGHVGVPLDSYLQQFVRNGHVNEEAVYRYSGYAAILKRRASHGVHVMDLATGNPVRRVLGVAGARPEVSVTSHDADIVFVELPTSVRGQPITGLLRANVFDAVRYVLSCATPDQPVVINLSYGSNCGPHDGGSVLEEGLDMLVRQARARLRANVELVLPAGNARLRNVHAQGRVRKDRPMVLKWLNQPDDPSDSFVEIWLPARSSLVEVCLTPPGAPASAWIKSGGIGAAVVARGQVVASIIAPERVCQSDRGRMILIAVARTRLGEGHPVAPYGTWELSLRTESTRGIAVHAWCERDEPAFGSAGAPRQARFAETPTASVSTEMTLNSIAHGAQSVVVGGRVMSAGAASYSGTGPGRDLRASEQRTRQRRPGSAGRRGPEHLATSDESVAVQGIHAAALLGSDTVRFEGTSMAAAVMTRRIIDHDFQLPVPPPVPRPLPARSIDAIPRHPDSDLP